MARFTYHGPVQSIPMAVGITKNGAGESASKFKTFDLIPSKETDDLPDGHPIVASMVHTGMLTPSGRKKTAVKPGTSTQGDT